MARDDFRDSWSHSYYSWPRAGTKPLPRAAPAADMCDVARRYPCCSLLTLLGRRSSAKRRRTRGPLRSWHYSERANAQPPPSSHPERAGSQAWPHGRGSSGNACGAGLGQGLQPRVDEAPISRREPTNSVERDILIGSGRFRRGNNVLVSTSAGTRETDQPAWMEPAKEPATPSMRPSMTRLRSLAPPNPISKAGTTRVRTTWSSTALRRRERVTPRCLSQHSVGQLGFARSQHTVTSKSSPDLCAIGGAFPDFHPTSALALAPRLGV